MAGKRIDYGCERQRHEVFIGRATLLALIDGSRFAADSRATGRAFGVAAAPGRGLDARFVDDVMARADGNLPAAAYIRALTLGVLSNRRAASHRSPVYNVPRGPCGSSRVHSEDNAASKPRQCHYRGSYRSSARPVGDKPRA